MTCPEQRLVEFLAGGMSEQEERRVDAHLLTCEECWRAVQADRAARLALEQLRQPAPAGLQGRVLLSVALAAADAAGVPRAGHRGKRPERLVVALGSGRLRLVTAACLAVAVAAGAAAWVASGGGPGAGGPAQVSEVAAMVTPHKAPPAPLMAGEHMVIGGQPLMVRAYEVAGTEAVVATSAMPFPVPARSHLLSGSSSRAWMATEGHLSIYGVNRAAGRGSMFLVAAIPMAQLPQVAARLHLI